MFKTGGIIVMEMESLSRILSFGSFTNAGRTYKGTTLQTPLTLSFPCANYG